jgi:hypothetical protein
MRADSRWKSTRGSRWLMRRNSMIRSWDAFPFSKSEGVLGSSAVIYLISYFAAGDSLRSSTLYKRLSLRLTTCCILFALLFCAFSYEASKKL